MCYNEIVINIKYMEVHIMKIFNCGRFEEIELGQKVLVARCGSGHTIFGEFGTITKFTKTQVVVTTDSGTIVKTDLNLNTIGKANKNDYFVSTKVSNRDNLIVSKVHYWNDQKCCMEYK
jgi:hypothetical protein